MSFYRSIKIFFLKLFLYGAIIVSTAVWGLFYYASRDLPDYSQLARYSPPSVTRIYTSDGKLIEEYAVEHRVFVPIESIPKSLIEAFISAEDKNFYSHQGIDFFGIIRASIANIDKLSKGRRMQGASTITQQVVKNILLSSEYSFTRKIKEAILSYRISKIFTKDKILELYLNQIYLGRRAYGVAVAAQNYFNKSIDDLNLQESAFLAGLAKAPENFKISKNYDKCKERRDYVLNRMFEDDYISKESLNEAINSPIEIRKRDKSEIVAANYFAEEVRAEVVRMLGKDAFLNNGLTIITSLDSNYQEDAEKSFKNGIEKYDRSRGYRGSLAKINNINNDKWVDELKKLNQNLNYINYKLAVVLDNKNKKLVVGFDENKKYTIDNKKLAWCSSTKTIEQMFKKGDVVAIKQTANSEYDLFQLPKVNGGMVVMNYQNGQVLAMVGGYDFNASKFNRVTQAQRQPGSTIKSLVYLAALEKNIKPNTIFNDGPIEISQGPGMPKWRPKNYKGDFLGNITMRAGLEKSRNLITVRVSQAVGLKNIGGIINRFDVNDTPRRFFSMSLGALETTLLKMTKAYGAIANYGSEITPSYIELIKDHSGRILYKRQNEVCTNCGSSSRDPNIVISKSKKLTDEASAYQMISLLEGATIRGTSSLAGRELKKTVAGKTGTTNKSMDTWYIGFSAEPKIIVGNYIGYDNPKELGKSATGASICLPIFVDFMKYALEDAPKVEFDVPNTIKLTKVDPKTGVFYDGSSGGGFIYEAFKTNEALYKGAANKDYENSDGNDNGFEIMKDEIDIFENNLNEQRKTIDSIDKSQDKLRKESKPKNEELDLGEEY